jgi:exonuclease SbcC
MILSRFLKPKWQHTDPDDPPAGPAGLETHRPEAGELARQDPDPAVRCGALERLSRSGPASTPSPRRYRRKRSRAAARDRYRPAGRQNRGWPTAGRTARAATERHASVELMEYLLQHAVRTGTPAGRTGADRCGTCAHRNRAAGFSSGPAAGRAGAGSQDPEAARPDRPPEPQPRQAAVPTGPGAAGRGWPPKSRAGPSERLCAEMEQLRWDGESGSNAGRFPKLEQEWREQDAAAPEACANATPKPAPGFWPNVRPAPAGATSGLELGRSLESPAGAAAPDDRSQTPNFTAAIHNATHDAPLAWNQLGPAQDAESRRLDARFQQLVHDIHAAERASCTATSFAPDGCGRCCGKRKPCWNNPVKFATAEIKQLAAALGRPGAPESRAAGSARLQSRLDQLFDKLRARLQRQLQQRDQEWQELAGVGRPARNGATENGELATRHRTCRSKPASASSTTSA